MLSIRLFVFYLVFTAEYIQQLIVPVLVDLFSFYYFPVYQSVYMYFILVSTADIYLLGCTSS